MNGLLLHPVIAVTAVLLVTPALIILVDEPWLLRSSGQTILEADDCQNRKVGRDSPELLTE